MKVGDYVRTKDGKIGKIIQEEYITPCNDKHRYIYLTDADNEMWYDEDTIINSSLNIIDLIEIGDIVNYEQLNGGVVLNKKDDSIDTWSILPNSLKNEDIKSVITKEQLKNCMYEVGEINEKLY